MEVDAPPHIMKMALLAMCSHDWWFLTFWLWGEIKEGISLEQVTVAAHHQVENWSIKNKRGRGTEKAISWDCCIKGQSVVFPVSTEEQRNNTQHRGILMPQHLRGATPPSYIIRNLLLLAVRTERASWNGPENFLPLPLAIASGVRKPQGMMPPSTNTVGLQACLGSILFWKSLLLNTRKVPHPLNPCQCPGMGVSAFQLFLLYACWGSKSVPCKHLSRSKQS